MSIGPVGYPHTFVDGPGNTASGEQVMDDLQAVESKALEVADAAGLNVTGGDVRRGKSIIPASQSRTNAAYGLLTTPDRVQNLVLPTDGLICVAYQAVWQESVLGAASAAIFVGANQLKVQSAAGGPVVESAVHSPDNPSGGLDAALSTFPFGLASAGSAFAITAEVTTGQVVGIGAEGGGTTAYNSINYALGSTKANLLNDAGGTSSSVNAGAAGGGACLIFAAAGTYDVSVQFKASSGSVTVKNRKLWCWTMDFA